MSTADDSDPKPLAIHKKQEESQDRPGVREYGRLVLRPSPRAVGASALAMLAFVVLLEFLVVISFVGQKLWNRPKLFHDTWFTLPAYMWFGVLTVSLVAFLRIASQALIVTNGGVQVWGLFRMPGRLTPWENLQGMYVVRDVYRGKEPRKAVDNDSDAPDALFVMSRDGKRIANLSGGFYGARRQTALLHVAENHEVPIEYIDQASFAEIEEKLPRALSFLDKYANGIVAGILVFYLLHNVLTFIVWGL